MLHIRSRFPVLSKHESALVGITAIWGATFLIIHTAMNHSGPLFFVGVRFLTAGLIGLVVFRRALAGLTWRDLGAGSAIGVTIFLGYGLQTWGLQTVSSSSSAFITALYVPMVPLLQWMLLRRAPRPMTWAGIGLAFTGLVLLAGPGAAGISLSAGEIATLISAVAIAAEIILIGLFAGKADLGRITVVQLFVGGGLSLLMMPVVGEPVPAFSWVWLIAAVGLGAASYLIQLTMNWAQRAVSPTRATIIYAGEPVWGGVIGRLAGDRLPGLALLGAVLIVLGVIVSELKPRRRRNSPERAEVPGDAEFLRGAEETGAASR
ncbi:Threonine/homoserine efflux transporter RhtA [Saccharopolyspora kobensis]|uniref:Threonine/homoserine efflux transporter RhtA n=1 Tax=Saccharopolyspora kobensis TaxID=146035 RepID=A0A1H5VFF8_9PSEU|nr:DMT family transporter [Saccharopolyspora kobensis]SEF85954.1 Threonine/homoserine efflux transporter RhtA [Saccharopolyspora kobensis]SFC61394.1 Threonine/homoserine efflux transporter RhtA [Saccharopolyspora kobensis]